MLGEFPDSQFCGSTVSHVKGVVTLAGHPGGGLAAAVVIMVLFATCNTFRLYWHLLRKKTSVKLNPNTIAPTTNYLRGRFLFCIKPLSKPLQLLEAVHECDDEHKESFLKWSRHRIVR